MCIGKKKKPSREKGIWSSKGEDKKYGRQQEATSPTPSQRALCLLGGSCIDYRLFVFTKIGTWKVQVLFSDDDVNN